MVEWSSAWNLAVVALTNHWRTMKRFLFALAGRGLNSRAKLACAGYNFMPELIQLHRGTDLDSAQNLAFFQIKFNASRALSTRPDLLHGGALRFFSKLLDLCEKLHYLVLHLYVSNLKNYWWFELSVHDSLYGWVVRTSLDHHRAGARNRQVVVYTLWFTKDVPPYHLNKHQNTTCMS
jgi:hypothetical protein